MYNLKMRTYTIKCAEPPPGGAAITHAQASEHALRALLANEDADREHFAVLYLNAPGKIIAGRVMFSGGTTETPVFVREVCRAALLLGSTRLVVAHTHPGGSPEPSPEDYAVTRNLAAALKLFQIHLLDHLVIAGPLAARSAMVLS